jgi:hypothetical protein
MILNKLQSLRSFNVIIDLRHNYIKFDMHGLRHSQRFLIFFRSDRHLVRTLKYPGSNALILSTSFVYPIFLFNNHEKFH